MNFRPKLRVGAVNYLNTKPLIRDFAALAPGAELVLDLPSRLADGLAAGRYDVALVPSIEFLQAPDYAIVSDACIGCRGPVLSVKLFFRTPPERVQTLALDEGSRTSVALARILLERRFGVLPRLEPLPIGASLSDVSSDAVLLIGDRAMHSPGGPFAAVWDLGDEWQAWTGLPFVFAMWVARVDAKLGDLPAALTACRDRGVAQLERIAAEESAPLGLSRPECLAYLENNLHFYLGPRERAGLNLFHQLARELRLAPPGVDFGQQLCQTA